MVNSDNVIRKSCGTLQPTMFAFIAPGGRGWRPCVHRPADMFGGGAWVWAWRAESEANEVGDGNPGGKTRTKS